MSENLEKKIRELEQAISVQESLRPTVGDSVVDAAIDTLREKLAEIQQSLSEERKLVTCLFCDVVGSTRLAANRDPEEVLNIVDGALQEMKASIEHYGGHVARYMGDGVLATFGAPKAMERHAQQAILAGLEIQSRMRSYAQSLQGTYSIPEFFVRVGINSGYVVAGRIAGNQGEYTVIGDMVNIASRIEEIAPPGGVLIGASTYKLAHGDTLFEIKGWDPITVKGSSEPMALYEVVSAIRKPGKKQVRKSARAKMTGRDHELSQLKTCFEEVHEKSILRACTVVGPAGIGKSRLKEEFIRWLQEERPETAIWVGRALSYEAHSPYRLIADMLRKVVGIHDADSLDDRRQKLYTLKDVYQGLKDEHVQGLGAIVAIDFDEDGFELLEPQARRNAIFNAFAKLCALEAEQRELVLVLEDTHWADELSLELLEYVFNALPDRPIQILMMTRPVADFNPKANQIRSRISKERYAEIQLADLKPAQTRRLVQELLGTEDIPRGLLSTIVAKTQGNPFFIEEIVNALVELGALYRTDGRWIIADEDIELHVPDNIQGVLAARIDQLDPTMKQIVQHAAIIGRTFWQQLLSDLVEKQLDAHLSVLNEQDFIEKHEATGFAEDDIEWIFRHVLLQEVAYESVLKEVRREVHRQIAVWLERRSPDRLEELAPTLARHYECGQVWESAIDHYSTAAARAKGLFSPRDAVRFYDRAIELAEGHIEVVDKQTVLALYENRGEALGLAGEWEAAVSDLSKVLVNAKTEGNKSKEHRLHVSLGMVYRRADNYDYAMANLNKALETAREVGDQRGVADVLYHLGSVAWSEGNNLLSSKYHQEAVEICERLDLDDLVAVQALHGMGEAYGFSGFPVKAIEYLTKSFELARDIGDLSYESENLQMIGFMHQGICGTGEPRKVIHFAEKSLEISQKNHMDWHTIPALLTLASPYIILGDYDRALEVIKRGNEQAERIGSLRMLSIGLDHLGHVFQELNMLEEAENIHAQAQEVSKDIGSNFWIPRISANLCIDRLRLGNLEVGEQLEKTLMESKERDQIAHGVRAIEGLAELSVAKMDPGATHSYAGELESIATNGGMAYLLAQAFRWWGEAHLLEGQHEEAEQSFLRAAKINRGVESPRLSIDMHDAMSRALRMRGDDENADLQDKAKFELMRTIVGKLKSPELSGAFSGVFQSDAANKYGRSGS